MAGARIELELSGLALVQQRLNLLGERAENLQPAFEDIGEMLLLSHFERWGRQESPDGTPWAPLSEDYRKRKPRNQDHILRLYDQLRDTLAYQASPSELLFGSNRVYAAIHQFGGRPGMSPALAAIEARPFLGIGDDDQASILDILEQYLLPE